MTLEDLVREVRANAEAQVKDIRDRTLRETEGLHIEGTKETALIQAKESEAAEREVERETLRLMASAKLEAKKIILDAQEKRLDGGLALLLQRLKAYTTTPDYFKLLEKMADTGIELLGSEARLLVRKEDLSQLSPRLMIRVLKEKPLTSQGGLIIESPDGKRRISLTFEELLRWKEDRIRELLSRQ